MNSRIAILAVAVAVIVAGGVCMRAGAQSPPSVSASERTAIFKAVGAVQRGNKWQMCADEPSPEAEGASIDEYRDLNGDGRPEAVLGEGGSFCYGFAGHGYVLLSKQADGSWKTIDSNNGYATFLKTKGKDGWPDIEVGGPGFCFPVTRWNGSEYALNRNEYEGKTCKPEQ